MIGAAIKHYKILEKLGEGGMGVVYKAEDTMLKRTVALKFLPRNMTWDERAKQRFTQEAQAASGLDHANICTIYETGETADGQMFIVMAYCAGQTLAQKIESNGAGLPIKEVTDIMLQIARGLSRTHEAGIVHRDIKPTNVVITERGEVKIVDFGMAKLAGKTRHTGIHSSVGTVAYMSPEQSESEKTDERADIWALGVILYEMLTGQLPFQGEADQVIIYSIVNEEPTAVAELRPGVPEKLQRVIRKALTKDPEDRYKKVDQVLADLEAFKKHTDSSSNVQRRYLTGGLLIFLLAFVTLILRFVVHVEPDEINSIAVLPLKNLTNDPKQEYLTDGMTDELITAIARIPSLRVISRTSVMQYKTTTKSIPEIAQELKVDAILEGSVRSSDEKVRITTQLRNASDEQLLVKSYDRDLGDILVLSYELAANVAHEIRKELNLDVQMRPTSVRQVNPEAYQLYLRGRFFDRRYDQKKAIEAYEEALTLDPQFAKAYAHLTISYTKIAAEGVAYEETYPKAKAAAMKAIELDSTLATAHAALGSMKFIFEWNWIEPEKHSQRAIMLDPNDAEAKIQYSFFLVMSGRFEEGIHLIKSAIELDPFSWFPRQHLGWAYYHARRFDEAISQFRDALDIDPNASRTKRLLALSYVGKGMFKEAIDTCEAGATGGQAASGDLNMACADIYAASGQRAKALNMLGKLLELAKHQYVDPVRVARLYGMLGEKDKAFNWLQVGYEQHAPFMVFLRTGLFFDPLRDSPRFDALLAKMGLSE